MTLNCLHITTTTHIMFDFITSVFAPKLIEIFTELAWAACGALLAYAANKVCKTT
jgi:TRAP-type C4-dicarboxylate transport system permease small subunit